MSALKQLVLVVGSAAVGVVLLCAETYAQSDAAADPIDDSGYSWGMSKTEFLKLMRTPDQTGRLDEGEILVYGTQTPRGPAIQQFTMVDGRLFAFSLGMEGGKDRYDEAVAGAVAEFGQPDDHTPVDPKHIRTSIWYRPRTQVTVALEQGQNSQFVVMAYASRAGQKTLEPRLRGGGADEVVVEFEIDRREQLAKFGALPTALFGSLVAVLLTLVLGIATKQPSLVAGARLTAAILGRGGFWALFLYLVGSQVLMAWEGGSHFLAVLMVVLAPITVVVGSLMSGMWKLLLLCWFSYMCSTFVGGAHPVD